MRHDPVNPPIEPDCYSFERAFSQGWTLFTSRYGMLMAAAAIASFFGAIRLILEFTLQPPPGQVSAAYLVTIPIAIFIMVPVQASTSWSAVAASRGEPATADTLFRGFSRYWQVLGVALLWMLLSLAVVIPLTILAIALAAVLGPGAPIAFMLIFIPLMIVMLWAYVRYEISLLLAMDRESGSRGPLSAFTTSFSITPGIKAWSFLGLSFVLGLIMIVSFLLLFLPGIFFGLPFMLAVKGMAYQQLLADADLLPARRCSFCGLKLSDPPGESCPSCDAGQA